MTNLKQARTSQETENLPERCPLATSDGGEIAALELAAEEILARAVEFAPRQEDLRGLLERLEAAGIPRAALGRRVLSSARLLALPTSVAIEISLALLLAFTEALATSLWTLQADGGLRHCAHYGAFDANRRQTRWLARSLLAGRQSGVCSARDAVGVLIERAPSGGAALIARGRRGDERGADERGPLLQAAAPVLAALLERDELLAADTHGSEEALQAVERRLTRLRFDLHDGPQQDLFLLGEDIRAFREQLAATLGRNPARERLLGRVDDLEARLVALDGDLRRIAAFVKSPLMNTEALPETLAKLCEAFAARAGIEPQVKLAGNLFDLTDSQQIALLSLIREALNNIREHSSAKRVQISVSASATGIEATVADDGRGFDPETTLVDAARRGHLGLVGMHERVRMLGGVTRIDSRPGGPTVISVSLPAWRQVA
jgi:signal transduction histidine kinase